MAMVPSQLPRFSVELEDVLLRFDASWRGGPVASLREFVPPQAGPAFLMELVRIDITRRSEQDGFVRVETYLEVFPELASERETLERLRQLGGEVTPRAGGLASTRVEVDGSDATQVAPGEEAADDGVVLESVYSGLRRHAEGGLGEVLVAREPGLGRRVAIKALKAEWAGSPRARRDFLQEAAVTGRLDHPGIVPVHSLGRLADGRPCYSMRYVEGETLADAVRRYHHGPGGTDAERAVAFRALLARFVSMCNTVAYAHSRGVLHRDLKPQNVLLGPFGETVVVDWGLAKVTDLGTEEGRPSGNEQFVTKAGDVLGTPAYMAPEQAAGRPEEVGPATDVFGLGATLYAVLTGVPPYRGVLGQGVLESARTCSSAPAHVVNPAAPRALGAVCARAMAACPRDRYGSALEVAGDVERWLAGEAVSAWPDAWPVRLKRAVRRRKALYAAVAVLVLILPPAASVSSWLVGRAQAQAELDRETARIKETAATQMTQYLVRLFQSADPLGLDALGFRGPGDRADGGLARRLLGRGAELIRGHLQDQPLARADLLESIGNSFRNLGDWGAAEGYLRDAYSLRREHLGEDDPATVAGKQSLARLAQDRGDYAAAEALFREVLRVRTERLGTDHLAVAETQFYLAWLTFHRPFSQEGPQFQKVKLAEAERLLKDALAVRERRLPKNHRDIGLTLAALASVKISQEQVGLALTYAGRALEIFRVSEADEMLGNVLVEAIRAEDHRKAGRFAEAEGAYLKLLALARRHLGPGHPLVIMQLGNLAGLYNKQGDEAKAERVAREILELVRPVPHLRCQPLIVDGMILFTDKLRARGELAEARRYYEEALRYARERPAGNEGSLAKLEARLRELAGGNPSEPRP